MIPVCGWIFQFKKQLIDEIINENKEKEAEFGVKRSRRQWFIDFRSKIDLTTKQLTFFLILFEIL